MPWLPLESAKEIQKEALFQKTSLLIALDYNTIGLSEDMNRRNRQVKDFLYKNLYRHPRVIRTQVKTERIINDRYNGYIAEPAMFLYQ
jgi:dGTPase